jgi:hypothetical protein
LVVLQVAVQVEDRREVKVEGLLVAGLGAVLLGDREEAMVEDPLVVALEVVRLVGTLDKEGLVEEALVGFLLSPSTPTSILTSI